MTVATTLTSQTITFPQFQNLVTKRLKETGQLLRKIKTHPEFSQDGRSLELRIEETYQAALPFLFPSKNQVMEKLFQLNAARYALVNAGIGMTSELTNAMKMQTCAQRIFRGEIKAFEELYKILPQTLQQAIDLEMKSIWETTATQRELGQAKVTALMTVALCQPTITQQALKAIANISHTFSPLTEKSKLEKYKECVALFQQTKVDLDEVIARDSKVHDDYEKILHFADELAERSTKDAQKKYSSAQNIENILNERENISQQATEKEKQLHQQLQEAEKTVTIAKEAFHCVIDQYDGSIRACENLEKQTKTFQETYASKKTLKASYKAALISSQKAKGQTEWAKKKLEKINTKLTKIYNDILLTENMIFEADKTLTTVHRDLFSAHANHQRAFISLKTAEKELRVGK